MWLLFLDILTGETPERHLFIGIYVPIRLAFATFGRKARLGSGVLYNG